MGGFESILTKMNGGNYNWFLHTMLFMHTMHVIRKQADKGEDDKADNEDEAEVDVEDEA